MISRLAAVMFGCTLAVSAAAENLIVFAPDVDEADWLSVADPLSCRLKQQLPGFGQVEITKPAGEPMRMELVAFETSRSWDEVVLTSHSTPWSRILQEFDLGRLELNADTGKRYSVDSVRARAILDELLRGQQVSFRLIDTAGGPVVMAYLSPVGFIDAYERFAGCVAEQFPYGYPDLFRTAVYFPVNGTRVGREGQRVLRRLAEFIKLDNSIEAVEIEGFTDNTGRKRYNQRLSRERAASVKQFLIDRGVPESVLKTNTYGESRPASSNRTSRGRAENRMVRITLRRRAPL